MWILPHLQQDFLKISSRLKSLSSHAPIALGEGRKTPLPS
jgi:hypothetical protein